MRGGESGTIIEALSFRGNFFTFFLVFLLAVFADRVALAPTFGIDLELFKAGLIFFAPAADAT